MAEVITLATGRTACFSAQHYINMLNAQCVLADHAADYSNLYFSPTRSSMRPRALFTSEKHDCGPLPWERVEIEEKEETEFQQS